MNDIVYCHDEIVSKELSPAVVKMGVMTAYRSIMFQ